MAQLTDHIGQHSLILQANPEGAIGAFIKRVCESRSKTGIDASFTEGEQGLAMASWKRRIGQWRDS